MEEKGQVFLVALRYSCFIMGKVASFCIINVNLWLS